MDQKDPDEDEPDLLFILTDPSTKQKPPTDRQIVNRYVQHYSQRKRKQVAAKRLSSKGPIPFLRRASRPQSGSSKKQRTSRPDAQTDYDNEKIEALTNTSGVGSCSAEVADSSALISRHSPPLRTHQSGNPSALPDAAANIVRGSSPRSFFSIAELDPFASSTTPLTPSMNRAFYHFLKITLPGVFPSHTQEAAFTQWFVQLGFGAPRALFAMIASAAADTCARRGLLGPQAPQRSGQPPAIPPAVSELLQYKTKTIRLLNESMTVESEATAVSTMVAIPCLLTVNWILGEQSENAVHAKGLEKVMGVRGGLHGIPLAIAENTLGTLYCASAMIGSLPRASSTSTLQTLPLSVQETIMSAIDPELWETGFAVLDDAFVSALFSLRLRQNFSDRREALFFRECLHSIEGSRSAMEPELEQYMMRRFQLRFEAVSAADDMSSDVAVSLAEQPCRIALLTFWLANYFPSRAIIHRLSKALKAAVAWSETEDCSFWTPHSKLLMWVLFIGAHSSPPSSSGGAVGEAEDGQRGEEGEVRRWFVFQLRRVARDQLCLSGWQEVRKILKQHYYVDRVYRMSLMKIWEEVMSG